MLLVVPAEEFLAEGAGILQATETIRKVGAIFEGAELTLRVGIVIRDVRAAVGLGNAQVGQHERHRLGDHRSAPVAVNIELARWDVVHPDGLFQKALCQFAALTRRHHPAGNVAAEDVEHHIKVEVSPLDRTAQLRNVPTPQLVRRGGQQLWLSIRRMDTLFPAVAGFARLVENPIHRAGGTQEPTFIQ